MATKMIKDQEHLHARLISGIFQPREENSSRRYHYYLQIQKMHKSNEWGQALFSIMQCQNKGQGVKTATQEVQ